MDIERLKEFLVITETGSFKSAATLLQVSPTVLSARFSGFEKSMGAKLLERNSHYVKPTAKGELLLRNASDIISSWETTKTSVRGYIGTVPLSLNLQLFAGAMPAELGPFLDKYSRSHPQLFLNLYDDSSIEMKNGLASGDIDIAFVPGFANDFTDINGRIVLSVFDHPAIYVPYDHPFASYSALCFEDLSGETFCLYPKLKNEHIRNLQAQMLDRAGIPYQIYESHSSLFLNNLLVPIGKGLQFWTWSDTLPPNTSKITIKDNGYETYYYLLYDPKSANPILQEFIQLFLAFRKDRP